MTTANRAVGPDGHVDVDVISDLVEGDLLDAVWADEAEAHIAGCEDCRATRDALAEIRDLLGAQPAEPMPDDVFAGIQAALSDAAPSEDARPEEGPESAGSQANAAPTAAEPGPDNVIADIREAVSEAGPTEAAPTGEEQSEGPGSEDSRRGAALGGTEPPSSPAPVRLVPAPMPPPDPGSRRPSHPRTAPERPRTAPVVHLASARRRRRGLGALLAAAAVAAVVVGVGVSGGFGGSGSSGGSQDSAAQGAASAPGGTAESAAPPKAANPTGGADRPSVAALVEYTRANVADRVDALLRRELTTANAAPDSTPNDEAGPSDPPTVAASGAQPTVVPSCVLAAVSGEGTPTAAERARFEGRIAYVLAFAAPGGDTARVRIVDAACAEPPSRAPEATAGAPSAAGPPNGSVAGVPGVLYSATVPLR